MKIEEIERFYKTHSKFYDLTRPFFLFSRRKALSLLELKPNDSVLDLACGTGLNLPLISETVRQENITGIDYSEAMLARAKEKLPRANLLRGDTSAYNFNRKFDKIICTYSLSIIEQWRETIQNAQKHLTENGTFLILDFHPWRGVLKPPYPAFKAWLKWHGVEPERDYAEQLEKSFEHVETFILNSGYNAVHIAAHPIKK